MWPLLIMSRVIADMRPASAASEAIEAEVSLKVWDVFHGTLRWVLEANGLCEAGLCDLRGHRCRGLTEGLGRFASQSGCRGGVGERSERWWGWASEASSGGGPASEASFPPEASQ